ncbi:HAD family hydrolase [Lelliottia wanjuensis]|uniref:HAD family phosphatase n=1 Tax=Lelliottia wanjuensis TaxID=3050585 RepID=A0AAP4FXB6_9ENTR|nr:MULTISPECIES: HAD family phosphatase [unclassified Lelliottia]EDS5739616.1 HAD family phosphatase [Salmonella enterica subsp. enterica serovar Javiana]EEP0859190.1 HAD family phosphatase [Salmonella enterica]EGH8262071.1 HAD family phosphatase [Salmonella enterica]EGL2916308.1 HAD family phosphatase [Salmonella enterica]EJP9495747.1 HAD family phosphatase [Salmonella enterica]
MTVIRGVIFDMDGVLIDAREWHYQALNQALMLFGLTISRSEHLGEFDGLPTREKLRRLTLRNGLPSSLHAFINEMKQRYTMQLIGQHCWPVFEHQHALASLRREGYQLAVASNSIRDSIEMMLGRAQLLPYLNFYLSNEDVQKGKPSPEIYLKAFSRLNLLPHECVVVEDNPHGIAAARASGAHVLSVQNPQDVTLQAIHHFIDQCQQENNE